MEVKIVQFPETKVAVLEHRGSPALEYVSIKKMIEWRIENRMPPGKHKSYGVHYNDPTTVDPELYRVDLCTSVNEDVPENTYGIINKVIPGGRCALARHLGSREDITAARYLYKVWYPNSGESLRDFPMFFHYVNVGPDVKVSDMITDVYLPLE